MLTATVPLGSGTVKDLDEVILSEGVAGVIDTADAQGIDLPCQVGDPDLWFGDTPAELERAKHLCGDCPMRNACLRSAIARNEPWGVWGGEIFERGTIIARKRPRGRPRKQDRMHNTVVRQEEVA